MSEPKLISPMLDGFVMGDPISEHDGVRCCPAMKNDADDRYIVKIISNPASQKQMDALLLTGAFPDADAAKAYFKDLAEGIVEEVQLLQQFSQTEGFLSYQDHQIVEMTNGETGFDVYLLSDYRRTLDKLFRKEPMTHLGAINLGLDICAALSICRRYGYLYVDLKPSNIHIINGKEFRIADLGFVRLDSLKYASVPDRYRSQYTAPEITDAFSSLNETVDIYALGLILYQAYNGGCLPFTDSAPTEKLPAPAYADYEMSEIILKACDPDPQARWQDPIQMGQALVGYMQRNGANDVPIVPPAIPLGEEAAPETDATDDTITPADPIIENSIVSPIVDDEALNAQIETDAVEVIAEQVAEPDASVERDAEIDAESTDDVEDESLDAVEEDAGSITYTEDDYGNLSFLTDSQDETMQELDAEQIEYQEISEEVSQMMLQIDQIAEYEVPEPVVVPEAIDVPIPEPIIIEENIEEKTQADAEADETQENELSEDAPAEDGASEAETEGEEVLEAADEENAPPPKKKKTLRNVILILLAILVAGAAFAFYRFIYLQSIDSMDISGNESSVIVSISTKTDEALLKVICADAYGNKMTKPVVDGKAEFGDLLAGTEYMITVQIDGFHKLDGEYRKTYYTPSQTNIVQLNAVTGSENGSAIISFTIDGADSEQWQITYSTAGGQEQTQLFSGHSVTLTGLTVGESYTARIEPETELYLSGDQQITFVANDLIYAEGLAITGCKDGMLSVAWKCPEGVRVDAWSVHCYNDSGFSETVMTDQTNYTFEGIDESQDYTVEVSAMGQSVSQRTSIAENSITLDPISAQATQNGSIALSWSASAQVPQGGWIIQYTVSETDIQGSHNTQNNEFVIKEAIPGLTYHITIQAADETPVVCAPIVVSIPAATEFTCSFGGPTITGSDISLSMCKTPDMENWSRNDLIKSDYTTSFAVGEKASFVIKANKLYGISDDDLTAVYVIRDEQKNILNFGYEEFTWRTLWDYYYGELNLPALPSSAGQYTVTVYFNGGLVGEQAFTVTQ